MHLYDAFGHQPWKFVGMQVGDVPMTFEDTTGFENEYGILPKTSACEGVQAFFIWDKTYVMKNKGDTE